MEAEIVGKKFDIYSRVTNQIIESIEAGVKDYEMPWHQRSGAGLPRNAATGNVYRGVNTLALWAAERLRSCALPYWATFRQWQTLGARVRMREKGSVVVFYKRPDVDTDKGDGDARHDKPILRFSFVFNAEQVDGWQYPIPPDEDRTEKLRNVDTLIESLGGDIHYGGNAAYYSPRFDRIHMPDRRDFIDRGTRTATEGFYSVLLHEHIHWTGHAKRLNRDLSGRFGDNSYAVEELVAELGAAFLCSELGISVHPRQDHAAYVHSWLSVLRQQKSAIFIAASTATVACRYLTQLSEGKTNEGVCVPR